MLVKNLVSVPGPPPFKNPGSAPAYGDREFAQAAPEVVECLAVLHTSGSQY